MGPFVPIVINIVCPRPSGDVRFSSSVIPSLTSILNWSRMSSFPSILALILSVSGALKMPGISSVIRSKLIVAEPVFSISIVAINCVSR